MMGGTQAGLFFFWTYLLHRRARDLLVTLTDTPRSRN
jgi:hypothetical protein